MAGGNAEGEGRGKETVCDGNGARDSDSGACSGDSEAVKNYDLPEGQRVLTTRQIGLLVAMMPFLLLLRPFVQRGLLVLVLVLAAAVASAQTLLPNAQQQFLDASGKPLAGGFVYMYVPSTTTPKMTWQDPGLTVANSNPILLDSAGEARIWGSGVYRQVVLDANSGLVWDQQTSALVAFESPQGCTQGHVVVWGASGSALACDPSLAVVAHDLDISGDLHITGLNTRNVANSTVVDQIPGATARLLAFGPDINTPGNWQIQSVSSDSSIVNIPLFGTPEGVVHFGTGFHPVLWAAGGIPVCNTLNKFLVGEVTDATAPTYNGNYAGGGTVLALVLCDGANWKTR